MKIVSWNCNLALKKKFQAIENTNADIMVFQECENAEEDFFDGYRFFWTGRNENKGLGVLIKDKRARLHASFQSTFIYFLPIETDEFNQLLESLNFKSVYHQETGDIFGRETTPTLYHTKQQSKPYHIDYIYQQGFKTKSIDIYEFEDWISLSDHVPLCGAFEA